jgi:hypothetical protein
VYSRLLCLSRYNESSKSHIRVSKLLLRKASLQLRKGLLDIPSRTEFFSIHALRIYYELTRQAILVPNYCFPLSIHQMETKRKGVHFDTNVYNIDKAVELVPHRPILCDLNDRKSSGETPPLEVVPGVSPARRGWIHKGTDIVNDRIPRPFSAFHGVPSDVGYRPGRPIDTYKEHLRKEIENNPSPLRVPITKVQFGVWFAQPDQGRAFSVEYEREYSSQSANLAHQDNLICIDVSGTLPTRPDELISPPSR